MGYSNLLIFICLSFMHMVWGITLLVYGEEAAGVTSIVGTRMLIGGEAEQLGYLYLIASLLCLIGLGGHKRFSKNKYWNLFDKGLGFLGLQQFLLILGGYGSYLAIKNGCYLDGTIVPRPHIFNDLHVNIIFCILHLLAMRVYFHELKKHQLDCKILKRYIWKN